jgi:nucleoside-diphosphate-sugar epimerase
VDESTAVAPVTEQHRLRLEEERRVAAGPWSSLILRPAAIYGPGRGVQESLKRGTCRVDEHFVSRIHVDDLATHVEAGLLSGMSGAYPVADEEPCTSREIAEFCARLLNLPLPLHEHAKAYSTSRRVDGSAIRRALGITLRYPSYRVGIPASHYAAPISTSSSPAVK